MSSYEREKEINQINELIRYCELRDKKHKIISNKILPNLYYLSKGRLEALAKKIKKIKAKEIQREVRYGGD